MKVKFNCFQSFFKKCANFIKFNNINSKMLKFVRLMAAAIIFTQANADDGDD